MEKGVGTHFYEKRKKRPDPFSTFFLRLAGRGSQSGDPLIELGERLAQDLAATIVGGGAKLALQVDARQLERFDGARRLGIGHLRTRPFCALPCEFFHTFLNSRLSIDQRFASIAHMNRHLTLSVARRVASPIRDHISRVRQISDQFDRSG